MACVLIVTVTCPARPGIVERVSQTLLARQANWEESWMGRLGGVVAGAIKVSVAEEAVDALIEDLKALNRDQMTVTVKPSVEEDLFENYRPMQLRLSGADREGILYSFACFLAEHGVTLDKLQTQVTQAPWSGGMVFMVMADIRCPPSLDMDRFRSLLEAKAAEQSVDITLLDSRKTSGRF